MQLYVYYYNYQFPSSFRLALSIPHDNVHGYSKCSMYAVNFTEALANGTTEADPSWPVVACRHGWEYNFTELPYTTIATDLDWVCDNAALPSVAQSIFFVGAIVGGLLFGWIADRWGRIPALVWCNVIGFVAGIATAFSPSFWIFAFCRFLVGFAFDNCFTMMYILCKFLIDFMIFPRFHEKMFIIYSYNHMYTTI